MFIDGIKAISLESPEAKTWRFRYDRGQHRNLCVVLATPIEQEMIRDAIRFAVFGQRDQKLKAALVQITDGNGDAWVFDRQGEQFRCFRNRQLFDGRLDVCLKELFKDYLTGDAGESTALQACLKEFDLNFDGLAIMGLPRRLQQLRSTPWERAGNQRLETNQKLLEENLGTRKPLSRSQMEQLLSFGENLNRRQHAVQQQMQEVDRTFDQLSRIDGELATRLKQEIALVDGIAEVTRPLLDPAKNLRGMQERLQEVEGELQELCTKWNIKTLPLPDPEIDWGHALQVLTRFLACDKLEKAARKSIHDARTLIRPIYEGYRSSVGRFLQHDRQLIQELELSLKDLDSHVRQAAGEQERQRDNIAGKLNKLLGIGQGEGEKGEGVLGPHSLELSRNAVNQCLQAVGKLYAELERNQGEHDSKFQELEQRYERIVSEYGKAREQWLILSRQLNLPAELGVREMVSWMNHYGKISSLHLKRLKLQDEIQDYRQLQVSLVQLLEEWRRHTGSQKSFSLDNPNLALSEAKGMLQYADKKRIQLQKLQAISSQFVAYSQMKAKLQQDLELVQQRWRQGLEAWAMPVNDLQGEVWERIAQALREVLLLDNLFQEASKPLKNEQIFAPETFDVPIIFYFWKEQRAGNKARLQLLQQVELADDAGLALIFTEDATLADMLLKLGLSQGIAKPEAVAPVVTKTQKPLVSDKARAALEVFTSKQNGSPRNNI